MQMTLQDLRSQINTVDEELLKLLAERMDIAREISEIKKLEGLSIVDADREKELLLQIEKKAELLNLPPKEVAEIWQKIFELSHIIQK